MDVETLLMPRDCDAVMVGLVGGQRPRVFLKAGRPDTRMRFTLAHELGHYFISWHLGTMVCHSDPVEAGDDLGRWEEEVEANRFASEFLMPTDWLHEVFGSEASVADAIERVQEAKISAPAACYTLSGFLPTGHVLAIEESGVIRYLFKSAGTQAKVPYRGDTLPRASLDASATEFAQIPFAGRVVNWWFFESTSQLIVSSDARTTSEILREIFEDVGIDESQKRHLQNSIAGIGGHVKNVASDPSDPESLHAVFWQRLTDRPELEEVMEHPDFPLYVSRRAEELARRRV